MKDPIAEAAEDIATMRVRGAALIGKHAAKALSRFARDWDGEDASLAKAAAVLVAARPTAVSLPNAVRFVVERARAAPGDKRAALEGAAEAFLQRASAALGELGRIGAPLVPEGGTVLTICNSQAALAPMFDAARQGRRFSVIALETRPWRQGLLTVAQLAKEGIDASIAVDSSAWTLLQDADLVLAGADSIAQNGDTINKVGTGGVSVLARERGVPLYVCAETFKVHPSARTGEDVPIEERESVEVVRPGEVPEGVHIRNPVFDVTPAACVRAYVTEAGLLDARSLAAAARDAWRS